MKDYERSTAVTIASTQTDPWSITHREIPGERPLGQRSGTTGQQIVVAEDLGLRAEVRALAKRFTTHPVNINTLANDNWELMHPLNVTVEQRAEDEFIACLYDADLYGYGDSIPGALEDLRVIIVDQFEFLLEHERTVELGSLPKGQLEILRRMLVKVDA